MWYFFGMKKKKSLSLVSIIVLMSACSAGGGVADTTSTVAMSTTTLDEVAIRENSKNELISQLFKDEGKVDCNALTYQESIVTPEPHELFTTSEEISAILRDVFIFSNLKSASACSQWWGGVSPSTELCEDWILGDFLPEVLGSTPTLITSLTPIQKVARNFHSQYEGFGEISNETVLWEGGMTVYQIPSKDKLEDLEGFFANTFAAKGSTICELSTPEEGSGYGPRDYISIFGATGNYGPGFYVNQSGKKENVQRHFTFVPYPELGLLVVIKQIVIENGQVSGPTWGALEEFLPDVFRVINNAMLRNLVEAIATKGL